MLIERIAKSIARRHSGEFMWLAWAQEARRIISILRDA
jgi:hypothetical protein